MKKLVVFVLALFLFVSLFTGCQQANESTSENGGDKIVVGLSMSEDTQFLTNVRNAALEKAEELGIEVISLSGQNSVEKQINDVESFIAQGVDAIVLNPLDREALGNVVDQVKDNNIPLVEVNTFTSNDRYDVYVGSKEEEAGIIQGEYIKNRLGTSGNLVILYGVMGHSGQIGRYEGLKESLLDPHPDWKVVAEQTGNWQREEGLRIMEDWLQSFNDIDVVASQNDEMALGALQAIEAAGLLDEIEVLGLDASPDAVDAVKEGKLAITVFQDSYGQGQKAMEIAVGLIEGKEYEKNIYIPYQEVNKENADDFIKMIENWQ